MEFLKIINVAKIKKNQKVLDLACGNASISIHLENAHYYGIDPCINFLKGIEHKNLVVGSLRKIPFKNNFFDHVICLTGLHHENCREDIYRECYRVLADKGRFTIHEVKLNSNISIFLDEFVNQFNPNGHVGNYFGQEDIYKLQNIGFETKSKVVEYKWVAKNLDEMFYFMKSLFGLAGITVDEFSIGISKYFDINFGPQYYSVNWNLLSIEAIKI